MIDHLPCQRPAQYLPAAALIMALSICLPTIGQAQQASESNEVTVASWNLEWFYDHNLADNRSDLAKQQSAPSQDDWTWKRDAVADAIGRMAPTILALQEIENRQVLLELVGQIKKQHQLSYRFAFIDGRDSYTEQDVAYLYRADLVEYSRREQTREMYDSGTYYNLSKHLFARFQWPTADGPESLLLLNVHLRAGERGEPYRQRQCRLIYNWVQPLLKANQNVIVLGDLNATHNCEQTTTDSDIGILCRAPSDHLLDLHLKLDKANRATHLIGRQFDRILVSPSLLDDAAGRTDLVFESIDCQQELVVRGERDKDHRDLFYKIPAEERDISDHYPLIARFRLR